jgi:N-acetylglucosamine malate deacetylase 2
MRSHDSRSWQELSSAWRENRHVGDARIAVLAGHPDDETIGASTLLARFAGPRVIFLTDGAPRDRKLWSPDFYGAREAYSRLRRAEAEQALGLAGLSGGQIDWLGGVDQEAIFSADALACRLSQLLSRIDVDVLLTHPYEGGHPDHDTAALVAHLAIHTLCRESAPLLIEMTSYHAHNRQCVYGEFLNSDTAQELQLHLSQAERTRKAGMFAAYASQRRVLEGFPIDHERLRVAPEYDFTRAPHQGKLWYECMAWPMSWRQWRAIAMEKIAGVQELSCPLRS